MKLVCLTLFSNVRSIYDNLDGPGYFTYESEFSVFFSQWEACNPKRTCHMFTRNIMHNGAPYNGKFFVVDGHTYSRHQRKMSPNFFKYNIDLFCVWNKFVAPIFLFRFGFRTRTSRTHWTPRSRMSWFPTSSSVSHQMGTSSTLPELQWSQSAPWSWTLSPSTPRRVCWDWSATGTLQKN